jgi:hypothetical protein
MIRFLAFEVVQQRRTLDDHHESFNQSRAITDALAFGHHQAAGIEGYLGGMQKTVPEIILQPLGHEEA